jgi:hypothetical protein
MARHGITLLRVSLGVVFFLWFGVLKFFPGLSPAQSLAARTIDHSDIRNGARQRERSGACLMGVHHRNRVNHKSFYAHHAPIALRADDGNDNAHLSVPE